MKKTLFILIFMLSITALAKRRPAQETRPQVIPLGSYSVGARLWQEQTSLNDSTGRSYKLKNDMYGLILGYQRTNYKKGMSFRHEVYGFGGQANVQSDENTFTYFEKGVMVIGAGLTETALWRAEKSTAEFGLNLDVFYRRALYPQPSLNATMNDLDKVLFIFGPQVRWNIFGKTFLEQKIGYSPQAEDIMWNFSLVYRGSLW